MRILLFLLYISFQVWGQDYSSQGRMGTVTVGPDGELSLHFPAVSELARQVEEINARLLGQSTDGDENQLGQRPPNPEGDDVYAMSENTRQAQPAQELNVTLGSGQKIRATIHEEIDEDRVVTINLDESSHRFRIDENSLNMIVNNPLAQRLEIRHNTLFLNDGFIEHTLPATHLQNQTEDEPISDCVDSIQLAFNNVAYGPELLREFLSLQKEITLQKLAYAYLKLRQEHEPLEQTLMGLIRQKHQQRFDAIKRDFERIQKSDQDQTLFLLIALEDVKDVMAQQIGGSSPYHLDICDLKFIAILKAKGAGINFIHSVNRAYADRNFNVQQTVAEVQAKLISLGEQLEKLIKKLIYNACFEPQGMSCEESQQAISVLYDQQMSHFTSILLDGLLRYNQTFPPNR